MSGARWRPISRESKPNWAVSSARSPRGQLDRLLEAVRAREARRLELRRRLTTIEGRRPVLGLDDARLRRGHLARLADWRGLLIRQVSEARLILTTLLADRMVFTPRQDATSVCYEFRGVAILGRLLTGIVFQRVWWPQRDSNPRLSRDHAKRSRQVADGVAEELARD